MCRYIVPVFALLIIVLGSPAPLCAQEVIPPRYWLLAGFGMGTAGVAVGAEGSYALDRSAVSLRAIPQFALNRKSEHWEPDVIDLGLLYGYYYRNFATYALFSAGLGMTVLSGEASGAGGAVTIEHHAVPSIPLSVQAFMAGADASGFSTGIGLHIYANLNLERPYIGALCCIEFGWY